MDKIKKEEHEIGENGYLCLNPYCVDKNQRAFSSQHKHFNSSQCKKWIIKTDRLLQNQSQPYNLKVLDNLEIDFQKQPLNASKILQKLKVSEWKKWLSAQQSKIKKQLTNSIQIQFQALTTKIEQLIKKSSFIQDLKEIGSRAPNPTDLINQYYSSKDIQLQSLRNHILFKKVELKQRIKAIKSEVQKIYRSMMEDKSQITKLLSHQEQRQLHQYIFELSDNYFNKLQLLGTALNVKNTSYSVENEKMSLECIVCNHKTHITVNPTNKKTVKKYLAEQILIHLYCEHYQEIGFAYSRKISKTNVVDVSFPDFLEESKYFTTIKIIDRQSGPNFEQTYEFYKNNPNTYVIEIVCLKNTVMAKGKHIIVSVRQSIDLMAAIISYICTQRGQNVEVQSKKEYLKNGLAQILFLKGEQIEPPKSKKEQA